MPDAYIDSTYVNSHLGTAYVSAVQVTGINLTVTIEGATALIQGYLRNSGYSTPSTTTDELVKLATLGALRVMLSTIPEKNIPLPEGWEAHPEYVAYTGILSGDAQPSGHTLDKSGAVGGFTGSEYRSTITGAFTQKASRDELEGY